MQLVCCSDIFPSHSTIKWLWYQSLQVMWVDIILSWTFDWLQGNFLLETMYKRMDRWDTPIYTSIHSYIRSCDMALNAVNVLIFVLRQKEKKLFGPLGALVRNFNRCHGCFGDANWVWTFVSCTTCAQLITRSPNITEHCCCVCTSRASYPIPKLIIVYVLLTSSLIILSVPTW